MKTSSNIQNHNCYWSRTSKDVTLLLHMSQWKVEEESNIYYHHDSPFISSGLPAAMLSQVLALIFYDPSGKFHTKLEGRNDEIMLDISTCCASLLSWITPFAFSEHLGFLRDAAPEGEQLIGSFSLWASSWLCVCVFWLMVHQLVSQWQQSPKHLVSYLSALHRVGVYHCPQILEVVGIWGWR